MRWNPDIREHTHSWLSFHSTMPIHTVRTYNDIPSIPAGCHKVEFSVQIEEGTPPHTVDMQLYELQQSMFLRLQTHELQPSLYLFIDYLIWQRRFAVTVVAFVYDTPLLSKL
jgi:hypothetical protein